MKNEEKYESKRDQAFRYSTHKPMQKHANLGQSIGGSDNYMF